MKFSTEPMLMQLAEPEYMCPKCGDKFYVYNENKRPNKCKNCDLTFKWDWSLKYSTDETGKSKIGVYGMSNEEFERIVDKIIEFENDK